MNPQRWQAVGEVFEKALELPLGERTAGVDRFSNGDEDLRREVLSLLASHKAAQGGFVQEKIKKAVLSFHETALRDNQALHIGPYRLIRELGRGGMGTVFLAERDDDQYKATVAVKVVRPGMDTEFILARFRRERQTLARLQHPNIARLLDGGTSEGGLPYIVMEYVDGLSITTFAESRKLRTAERVRVFLDVCSAVDYAHRNFVVHRDLKPGNILIGARRIPKLLDFGICKLLGSDPQAGNETVSAMMTPNYASPEQLRGEAITLLSDIYSLGVVLYQLLTGKLPHSGERKGNALEAEIPLPSAVVEDKGLSRQLSGDLDNIVMRALEREPHRRYESAAVLADDLRRYLSNRPVRARAQTMPYQAYKFLRRYPSQIAAIVAVVLALAAGLAISIRQTRIADARLAQVRTMANQLVFDVHDAIRDLPGSTRARQLVVQTALSHLDSIASSAKGDAQAERDLASAYRRLGDVQGSVVGASLGDPAGALVSYRKGLALLQELVRRKPSDTVAQTELLVIQQRIGAIQAYTGKASDALHTIQGAIEIGAPLMAGADNELRAALADLYIESADLKRNMGDGKGSLDDASQALGIYREIEASGNTTPALLQSLATAYASVGMGEGKMGRLQDALAHYREGAAQMEKLVEADPHNTSLRRDLMVAYGHTGDVLGNPNLENLGDREAALHAYRQAAEIGKSLHDADPANEQAGADYAIALSRVATAMDDTHLADKIDVERESLRVLNQDSRVSPGNLSLLIYQAYVNLLLGDTLKIKGDIAAAEKAYQETAAISDSGRNSGHIGFVTTFVNANLKLAQLSAARGGRGQALELAQRALDASTRLPAGAVSPFAEPRGQAAMGLTYAALAHSSAARPGDREQAISWLHKSMDGWRRVETLAGFSAPHRREMREVNDTLAALETGALR